MVTRHVRHFIHHYRRNDIHGIFQTTRLNDQISTWGTLAKLKTIPINTLGRLKPKLDSNCCEGVIVKWGRNDFYDAYVESEFYVDTDKIQIMNVGEESKDEESKDEEKMIINERI